MKLKANGVELVYNSIVIKESFTQYYTEVVVIMSHPIAGILELDLGKIKIPVVVYEFKRSENYLVYTLIPKKVFDLLNLNFNKFKGLRTTEQLMAIYGVKTKSILITQSVNWDIPHCKLKTLMDYVKERTTINNGGGVLATINLYGVS